MDGHVRLTDFGLSKQLKDDNDRVLSMSGTAAYLAPEIIDGGEEGHGKSVDIWAFGVLMFTAMLHESPFYSENLSELFDMILHQDVEWEYFKEEISPEAYSLLTGLLTKDPSKRLGCGPKKIQEIKEHPFFASINWDDLIELKVKPFIRPKLRVAERATEQDKLDLLSGRVTKPHADRGEFADFSFVAADYLSPTLGDHTDTDLSSWSTLSEDEEEFAWPFPNGNLPFSAVNQIVSYLSISDISRASQVCKSWNKFLWSNIHEIDLSTVKPNLFNQYWSSHICKILKRPSRLLKIRMSPHTTDKSIITLPSITPLEVINFKGCPQITMEGIRNLARIDSKAKSKAMRPMKLKFPMLVELDLSYCAAIDDNALEQISKTLPLLKRLNLAFAINVTDSGLQHLIKLQHLWRLDLQGLRNLSDSGIKKLVDIQSLRVLELTGCSNLTSAGVESLRTKAKQLEVLIWSGDSEKGVNKGLAGLFSGHIKGSLFKVSRADKKPQTPSSSKGPSKNFLPSFKRKGKHKKTQSTGEIIITGDFSPDDVSQPQSNNNDDSQALNLDLKFKKTKEKRGKEKMTKTKRNKTENDTILSPRSRKKKAEKKSKMELEQQQKREEENRIKSPKERKKKKTKGRPTSPPVTDKNEKHTEQETKNIPTIKPDEIKNDSSDEEFGITISCEDEPFTTGISGHYQLSSTDGDPVKVNRVRAKREVLFDENMEKSESSDNAEIVDEDALEPKGKKKRPKSKTFFEDDEIELLAQAISPQNNDDKDDTHIISPKYKSLTASGKSIPTEPISPEKPKEQEDRDIKIDSNYSKSEPTVVVSSNTSTNNDVVDKESEPAELSVSSKRAAFERAMASQPTTNPKPKPEPKKPVVNTNLPEVQNTIKPTTSKPVEVKEEPKDDNVKVPASKPEEEMISPNSKANRDSIEYETTDFKSKRAAFERTLVETKPTKPNLPVGRSSTQPTQPTHKRSTSAPRDVPEVDNIESVITPVTDPVQELSKEESSENTEQSVIARRATFEAKNEPEIVLRAGATSKKKTRVNRRSAILQRLQAFEKDNLEEIKELVENDKESSEIVSPSSRGTKAKSVEKQPDLTPEQILLSLKAKQNKQAENTGASRSVHSIASIFQASQ